MKVKELLNKIDQETEPELHQIANRIPKDEDLSLDIIRQTIDAGSGSFTEAELLFLLLESLFNQAKEGNKKW